MSQALRLLLGFLAVILLLGLAAWYYLFGPNEMAGATLVPEDTVFYAAIPNGASIVAGYEGSQLKKLVDAPEAKPLIDQVTARIGAQNLALLQEFAPNLSGQSFIAVTHFDATHPAQVGLIAAFKAKAGMGNFDKFVTDLRTAYPRFFAQGTTGKSQVGGLDYEWIQGPGASDKICVARTRGWIVTTWGEAPLLDWWLRLQKKGSGPSLAQNRDYVKSQERVGTGAEARIFFNSQALMGPIVQKLAGGQPARSDYFAKRLEAAGTVSLGSSFEHGEITDRFSMMNAGDKRPETGWSATPCDFDTLKFTSPDTRFYYASSVDFPTLWANWQEQAALSAAAPAPMSWVENVKNWAQSHHLDLQRNVIGPLGHEISLQAEWSADNSYPDVGAMVKVDRPDDFKPTIAALLDTLRQRFALSAVVNEINSNGQNFATLKFVRNLPVSPTMTEDGPYFGIFLTENHAVRALKRDLSVGLANNPNFQRQIGDRRKGASAIVFFDSPQLLDRAYQTALPYVPLAAMVNPAVARVLQGGNLPANLSWLAPMGTWAYILTPDAGGFKASSSSGIGNQGIFLGGALGAGAVFLSPFFHHEAAPASNPASPAPTVTPMPSPTPAAGDASTTNTLIAPMAPGPSASDATNTSPEIVQPSTPETPAASTATNAAPTAPAPQ